MLRPAQVCARRADTPVVYIPIGTLEWHGPHNPICADTLQTEGLAMHPETVDLSTLPTKESGEPFIGMGGTLDARDATATFGRETTDFASYIIVREVQHRLENPRRYGGHGAALSTGLWKDND